MHDAPIDFDSHYYEAEDAFTRHMDPRLASRGVAWREERGRRQLLIGGQPVRLFSDPTFTTLPLPGSRYHWWRGLPRDGAVPPNERLAHEPVRAEYRDREARLARLDAQGLRAACLFPTIGMVVEHKLRADPEATHATLEAFNRWLDETWGFVYRERLFAAPMLSLSMPERAVAELERVLGRGARLVHLRAAPVPKGTRRCSLASPEHDPFWARVAEARAVVAFHAGDSSYRDVTVDWLDGRTDGIAGRRNGLMGEAMVAGRAIADTLTDLVFHGLFERFPGLRVVTVENGCFWVPSLLATMAWVAARTPGVLAEPPAETFRRHVWVTPIDHEDLRGLADLIGSERVLFSSDWPHPEGLAEPLAFAERLAPFDEAERRCILGDNAVELLGLAGGAG